MPRRAKIDRVATKAQHFLDKRSFVALDGSLRLYGEDWISQKIALFFYRDNRRCQECKWFYPEHQLHAHHIVKRSDGGGDELSNLRTLCFRCHKKRHPEKQVRWSATERKAEAAEAFAKLYDRD